LFDDGANGDSIPSPADERNLDLIQLYYYYFIFVLAYEEKTEFSQTCSELFSEDTMGITLTAILSTETVRDAPTTVHCDSWRL
jgi:hypothetical protein